jgi:hypothetical protein
MDSEAPQSKIIEKLYKETKGHLNKPFIKEKKITEDLEYISKCSNHSGARALMACLLAKIDTPSIDIRRPHTNLGKGSYSGRTYDERDIGPFIAKFGLPCNSTTAFLTPAFRSLDKPLTFGLTMEGRPKEMYARLLEVFDSVQKGKVKSEDVFKELLRLLILLKAEQDKHIKSHLDELARQAGDLPLSVEDIINLIKQHLACPKSSRLPVIIVASAYNIIGGCIGEKIKLLQNHTAADIQTGALGDIEVTLTSDDGIVTSYEMKAKTVTKLDINRALTKIPSFGGKLDNYIFITTEPIDDEVMDYAKSFYESTGIEIAILDCIGFLRHFLHLFSRLRSKYLDEYQRLVLSEPDSAISHSLKEAFLALRKNAEAAYSQ